MAKALGAQRESFAEAFDAEDPEAFGAALEAGLSFTKALEREHFSRAGRPFGRALREDADGSGDNAFERADLLPAEDDGRAPRVGLRLGEAHAPRQPASERGRGASAALRNAMRDHHSQRQARGDEEIAGWYADEARRPRRRSTGFGLGVIVGFTLAAGLGLGGVALWSAADPEAMVAEAVAEPEVVVATAPDAASAQAAAEFIPPVAANAPLSPAQRQADLAGVPETTGAVVAQPQANETSVRADAFMPALRSREITVANAAPARAPDPGAVSQGSTTWLMPGRSAGAAVMPAARAVAAPPAPAPLPLPDASLAFAGEPLRTESTLLPSANPGERILRPGSGDAAGIATTAGGFDVRKAEEWLTRLDLAAVEGRGLAAADGSGASASAAVREGASDGAPAEQGGVSGVSTIRSAVNMRSGPDNGASVVRVVPSGARIEVNGCGVWCDISFEGARGFVYRKFVTNADAFAANN